MADLGYKTGVIFPREDTKTYELLEGDFTVQTGINVRNGEKTSIGLFSKQVDEENFLVYGAEELSMELAPEGGVATHFNQFEPELQKALPTENKTNGNYTRRIVGASRLVPTEVHLPLASDNVEISVGNNLEIKGAKLGLDKSTATTNVARALESKKANSGGYILVSIDGGIRVKTTSP